MIHNSVDLDEELLNGLEPDERLKIEAVLERNEQLQRKDKWRVNKLMSRSSPFLSTSSIYLSQQSIYKEEEPACPMCGFLLDSKECQQRCSMCGVDSSCSKCMRYYQSATKIICFICYQKLLYEAQSGQWFLRNKFNCRSYNWFDRLRSRTMLGKLTGGNKFKSPKKEKKSASVSESLEDDAKTPVLSEDSQGDHVEMNELTAYDNSDANIRASLHQGLQHSSVMFVSPTQNKLRKTHSFSGRVSSARRVLYKEDNFLNNYDQWEDCNGDMLPEKSSLVSESTNQSYAVPSDIELPFQSVTEDRVVITYEEESSPIHRSSSDIDLLESAEDCCMKTHDSRNHPDKTSAPLSRLVVVSEPDSTMQRSSSDIDLLESSDSQNINSNLQEPKFSEVSPNIDSKLQEPEFSKVSPNINLELQEPGFSEVSRNINLELQEPEFSEVSPNIDSKLQEPEFSEVSPNINSSPREVLRCLKESKDGIMFDKSLPILNAGTEHSNCDFNDFSKAAISTSNALICCDEQTESLVNNIRKISHESAIILENNSSKSDMANVDEENQSIEIKTQNDTWLNFCAGLMGKELTSVENEIEDNQKKVLFVPLSKPITESVVKSDANFENMLSLLDEYCKDNESFLKSISHDDEALNDAAEASDSSYQNNLNTTLEMVDDEVWDEDSVDLFPEQKQEWSDECEHPAYEYFADPYEHLFQDSFEGQANYAVNFSNNFAHRDFSRFSPISEEPSNYAESTIVDESEYTDHDTVAESDDELVTAVFIPDDTDSRYQPPTTPSRATISSASDLYEPTRRLSAPANVEKSDAFSMVNALRQKLASKREERVTKRLQELNLCDDDSALFH